MYTWSDVNAFVPTKDDRVWDRLMFRTRKHVAQKHILKDGKNKSCEKDLLVACIKSFAKFSWPDLSLFHAQKDTFSLFFVT